MFACPSLRLRDNLLSDNESLIKKDMEDICRYNIRVIFVVRGFETIRISVQVTGTRFKHGPF